MKLQRLFAALLLVAELNSPVSAQVPPAGGGSGGGGGGSSTITSPVGSNTKAQSVSVTYATDQLLPAFAAAPTVILGAGSATFGAISNAAFGISGTLPAFASTPTFNLGTLNGAALDTSVQAVKTTLGSPFQAGGSVGNTGFNALQAGAATTLTNPLFVQISQAGAALSGTNALYTADQNLLQTIKAPGTASSFVVTIQGSASGVAVPVSGAVSQTGGPWTTNQTQVAGTALGAPTAYGTAPTGNVAGVNANVTASALPTGAATAAAQVRFATNNEFTGTAFGASATINGTIRAVPTNVSRYNVVLTSTQAGTATIQNCRDNACAVALYVAVTQAVTAGSNVVLTNIPSTGYVRVVFTGGATAGSVTADSSFTAD